MVHLFRRVAVPAGAGLFLFLLSVASGWATFGDPRGFYANSHVTEQVLAPGVILYRADGTHEGTPQVSHVVSVDLSVPNLSLRALPGERFVGSTQFFPAFHRFPITGGL